MSSKEARRITEKANRRAEKEFNKSVRDVVRTLKADIKRAAKKGVADFRCKIRDVEAYDKARLYFVSKGFRCRKYTSEDCVYLAIEW